LVQIELVGRLEAASIAAIDPDEPTGKAFYERQMEHDQSLDRPGQHDARRRDLLHRRCLNLRRELEGRIARRCDQRVARLEQKSPRKCERR
jgi:hypothetical protein